LPASVEKSLRTPDLDWRFRVVEENDSTQFRAEAGACPAWRQEGNWTMPQLQLPVFPQGLTSITEDLAFQKEDGKVVYFHGLLPVFQHDETDLRCFLYV
jgi:hypothetical protein